jgi:hypothetical protein
MSAEEMRKIAEKAAKKRKSQPLKYKYPKLYKAIKKAASKGKFSIHMFYMNADHRRALEKEGFRVRFMKCGVYRISWAKK